MPTYEYICENCGHKIEKFQSIKAGSVRKCPKCGKLSLKRLISSGAGIIFKGSGFYQTDYRSESYKSGAKNEKSATTPLPAKTETKKETKTANKKEKPKPTAT
jgi:putative FmdB family regulatory protein